MLGATAVGVVLIASTFLAVSLIVPRALLSGIVYAFVLDRGLGPFLPGVNFASTGHYVRSIFVALLNDPTVTIRNVGSLRASLITATVISIVALALATWRLRRMNIE
jgi:hypothetical protein